MKKVLAIASYAYLPVYNGGQKYIAKFLEHFGKRVELTVITVPATDASLALNYKINPLLKSSFSRYFDRSLVRKISLLIKEGGYDTIICEHPYLSWLVFALKKRTGVQVFFHAHNIEYQRFRSTGKWWWPFLKNYERRAFKRADGIFFISKEDKEFAMSKWRIPGSSCFDLPFGVDLKENPADRQLSKDSINREYGFEAGTRLILFAAQLDYLPNEHALIAILDKINPVFQKQQSLPYKILICGKGLATRFNSLKAYHDQHIVYSGFISDIGKYNKAADLSLNPVQSGGGVKTKMVEAIAYGSTVISTRTGSLGIEEKLCENKLFIVGDNDWSSFVRNMNEQIDKKAETPARFYHYYSWDNIIQNLLAALADQSSRKPVDD